MIFDSTSVSNPDQKKTTSDSDVATHRPSEKRSSAELLPQSRVRSTSLVGVEAFEVEVEAKTLGQKGGIRIVGLPDGVLREAKERVRCAISNSGFNLPDGEIIVSLSPADLPKTGSGFDLPIALAVLAAVGEISRGAVLDQVFLGELALDGRLRRTKGALAAGVLIKKQANLSLVVPRANAEDISILKCGRVYVADTLRHVVAYLNGKTLLENPIGDDNNKFLEPTLTYKDVKGQQAAIRACEIAAAGGHNLLLIGPPGSGKSMLAERLPSILPPLLEEELVEVLSIYDAHQSIRGSANRLRPFRAPHHTCSTPGLIGGGPGPSPGEISLAHNGVLFLDELPEFKREGLESLRQPLEERKLTLSRAINRVTFPANFTMIAAMNPCPCGKRGGAGNECRCHQAQIKKYLSKISGPLLERIDLQLWVAPANISDLAQPSTLDPTQIIKERVLASRTTQHLRQKRLNSTLSAGQLQKHAPLCKESKEILITASEKLNLSARSFMRTIKVARTIADLDNRSQIVVGDICEALSYRLRVEELVK